MDVALFIPCFIDACFPEVGVATLELLERLGCHVSYPMKQTCCGQPMANSGCHREAEGTERLFVQNFAKYDVIVGPSASCVHHIRDHLDNLEQTDDVQHVRQNTYELVEFLHDVLKVNAFPWASFPHRIGLHNSCSALRGLREASMTEIDEPFFSKPKTLLEKVAGIEFVTPLRPDECCGFGGTFSVTEAPVSVKMGQDKVTDHHAAGAEYIVSADMSCLMHQQGCAQRMGLDIGFLHIAQVLNGMPAEDRANERH